jgi:hypothetical protein
MDQEIAEARALPVSNQSTATQRRAGRNYQSIATQSKAVYGMVTLVYRMVTIVCDDILFTSVQFDMTFCLQRFFRHVILLILGVADRLEASRAYKLYGD